MQLKAIEQVILNNIGMRYDELSISTDAKEILDFAILHTCVNLAREEIKLNTNIKALNKIGTAIVVASGTSVYSLPSDFDVPITMYYWSSGGSEAIELEQMYVESLPSKIPVTVGSATPDTGTPSGYLILDTSTDLIQIALYPTPAVSGVILPVYKPVLTEKTVSTDEDTLMKRYPKTVIDFATSFAFQLLKKDDKQHDKYYGLGLSECFKIDLREMKADSNYKDKPSSVLIARRAGRLSK